MKIEIKMVYRAGESQEFSEEISEYFKRFPMELSLFQKFAIEAIVKEQHSLSCVPTGSGKTLPALFAIEYFTGLGKRVIYTSPIKALSNQKFYEFSQKFPDISFGILTGDNKINPTANVLIMTAEILQHKLQMRKMVSLDKYKDDEIDFDEVGCVINDEIHMINDEDRGHVWENIILSLPSHIPMVLLSATLDQPEKFGEWIEKTNPTKQVYLAESHKRHVPLLHYAFTVVPKQIFRNVNNETKSEINQTIQKFIPIQDENGTFLNENYEKVNKINELLWKHNLRVNRTSLLNDLCKKMVEKEMFPAVCFLLSKKQIDIMANEITTEILPFDSKVAYTIDKECDLFLRRKLTNFQEFFNLSEYDSLKKILRKGIATHHSGMIPILRELVELLFEKGEEILTKEFSLSQSELDVLAALYYGGGEEFTLTPTNLYDIMLFSSGGLTKVLKKLEEKEYIKRIDSNEDKRVKNVQITKSGIEITTKALDKVLSYEHSFFSKLDTNEQDEFKRLINKILD